MSPSVSIIIPVFNRERQASEAVRSALAQSFADTQIIVVDDGSNPPLKLNDELLEDEWVELVRLDENKGASAARNAGAMIAQGDWLAWLDSDDLWDSDKLKKQIAYLETLAEPKRVALATGFEYVGEEGKADRRIPIASDDPQLFFAGCWFCPGSTVILSRELFEMVGPYDENLRRLEDLDWFARMALSGGRLEVVSEVLASISTGQKAPLAKVKQAGAIITEKFSNDEYELPTGALSNLQAYLRLEYAASALKRDHNRLSFLYHMAASLRNRPRTCPHIHEFWW